MSCSWSGMGGCDFDFEASDDLWDVPAGYLGVRYRGYLGSWKPFPAGGGSWDCETGRDRSREWLGEWVWLWDGDCRVVVRPPPITLRSANQQPPHHFSAFLALWQESLLKLALEMFCPLITEWNLQDGSYVAPVGGELGEPLHVGLPLLLPLPVHLQVELGQADRRLLEQRAHHRASGHPPWCAGEKASNSRLS